MLTPELREFVLALPLDVRRELCKAKCDAAYGLTSTQGAWDLLRMSPDIVPIYMCAIEAPHPPVCAVVPVSPVAIALHAAALGNYGTAQVRVSRRTGKSWAWVTVDPDPSAEWLGDRWNEADAEGDPTGHRAAIALLQKVMTEKVTS